MSRERDFDTSSEMIGGLCSELLADGVDHQTLADALMVKAMAFWGLAINDKEKAQKHLVAWAEGRDVNNGN